MAWSVAEVRLLFAILFQSQAMGKEDCAGIKGKGVMISAPCEYLADLWTALAYGTEVRG